VLACLILPLQPFNAQAKKMLRGRMKKSIVIDPGHGGHEKGVRGPGGTLEKDVALTIARLIESELKGKYHVALTRSDDYWLEVARRTDVANHYEADVFISIHTGGSFLHKASGINIYYYKKTTMPPVSSGGARTKNPAVDEGRVLWDLMQEKHVGASRLLARKLKNSITERIAFSHSKIGTAPLLVLRGADMPAVLIEAGYLTNPSEEKHLRDKQVLQDFAQAIVSGIKEFFKIRAR
jgi:N-acetylmuramoyl-L-alanine amidase